MQPTATTRGHKLVITFSSLENLLDWFEHARRDGYLPEETGVYRPDGLDFGGRADARTYLVWRAGDRPEQARVRRPARH